MLTPNPPVPPVVPILPPWTDPALAAAFNALADQLRTLKGEVEELQRTRVEWITRNQAQQLLGVKETKLWQLTTRDNLIETSGRLVSLTSCRRYLADQAVSEEIITLRLADTLRRASKA